MRLTSKGRYAVRAMLDLAFHSSGNPVRLQEISTRQAISLHYLEQLFRKLRTGRVVKSVRGPGGGYILSRSMDEISIKDVLDCVGENINPAKDIVGQPSSGIQVNPGEVVTVSTAEFSLTREYFQNLGTLMLDYLQTTTLGDLYRKNRDSVSEVSLDTDQKNTAMGEDSSQTASSENRENRDEATSSAIRPPLGEINQ